jgi:hypothetical protein
VEQVSCRSSWLKHLESVPLTDTTCSKNPVIAASPLTLRCVMFFLHHFSAQIPRNLMVLYFFYLYYAIQLLVEWMPSFQLNSYFVSVTVCLVTTTTTTTTTKLLIPNKLGVIVCLDLFKIYFRWVDSISAIILENKQFWWLSFWRIGHVLLVWGLQTQSVLLLICAIIVQI